LQIVAMGGGELAVWGPDAEPLYGHIRMNKDSDSGRVAGDDVAS
jgi:hypothetical protein